MPPVYRHSTCLLCQGGAAPRVRGVDAEIVNTHLRPCIQAAWAARLIEHIPRKDGGVVFVPGGEGQDAFLNLGLAFK